MLVPTVDGDFVRGQWAALLRVTRDWWAICPGRTPYNTIRKHLAPFVRWCSDNSVVPEFVDDLVIEQFVAHARTNWAAKNGLYLETQLRVAWNFAACRIPGWPVAWVSVPLSRYQRPTRSGGEIVCFPQSQFHPALITEINEYCANGGILAPCCHAGSRTSHRSRLQSRLAWMRSLPPEFRATATTVRPLKPLSEKTLYTQRRVILRTATALHVAGHEKLEKLQKITDVVTPEGAAMLADVTEARLGAQGGTLAAKFVSYFSSISRRCGILFSRCEREALGQLRHDLCGASGPIVDISERNLKRLSQFEDDEKFAMLVALPEVVFGELEDARRERPATPADARLARAAVAIDLLNHLPIRLRSLISLDFERNFHPLSGSVAKLVIFRDQEKSQQILEAMVSKRTWRRLQLYRKHYRRQLRWADQSNYLFPGRRGSMGGHRLGCSIAELVAKRLGVQVHVHLWRHIMATKLSDKTRRPEYGQQLLGHVPGSIETKRYVRLHSKQAAGSLRGLTEKQRARGIALLARARVNGSL